MENNKIETLLLQILESQTQIQSDITEIKTKVNAVYNQTADLTEFRTETNSKLDKLSDDLDFFNHKEYQNEKEVFTIKKKLEIIK